MAKGHWQIYNWAEKENENWGNSETIPIDEVPEIIVKTASLICDGLYGVDSKMIAGQNYVIEVNDNPNIDEGIEDLILKDELYDRIMQSIFNRIEINRNIAQFISV